MRAPACLDPEDYGLLVLSAAKSSSYFRRFSAAAPHRACLLRARVPERRDTVVDPDDGSMGDVAVHAL